MSEKQATINEYLSYSNLQEFSTCQLKSFYSHHKKDFPPFKRGAAMVKGSAIHKAIAELHKNPSYSLDNIMRQEIDAVESESPIPVDWGDRGYDWHIKDSIGMLDSYWKLNQDIEILSAENWFYFQLDIDNEPVHFRGRFDQLIDSPERFIVRELKSGMLPDINVLKRDMQLIVQAYAILFGFMDIEEKPYIGTSDPAYHIHQFERDGDKFKCIHCNAQAIRLGIKPYRDRLIYYHIPSCQPFKKKGSPDEPRRNPEYEININSINFEMFQNRMTALIRDYRKCQSTGVWQETANTSWSCPCSFCDYSNNCNNYLMEVDHVGNGKGACPEKADG